MNLSPAAGTTLRVGHLAPSCFRSELPEAHPPFCITLCLGAKSVPPLKLDAPCLMRLGVSRTGLLAGPITERKSAGRKQRTYRPTSLRGEFQTRNCNSLTLFCAYDHHDAL